jgi:hypothetical protein
VLLACLTWSCTSNRLNYSPVEACTCDLLDYLYCVCLFPWDKLDIFPVRTCYSYTIISLTVDFPCSLGEISGITSGSARVLLLNSRQTWHDQAKFVKAGWSPRITVYISMWWLICCLSEIDASNTWYRGVWHWPILGSLLDPTCQESCRFLWWIPLLGLAMSSPALNHVASLDLENKEIHMQVWRSAVFPLCRTLLPSQTSTRLLPLVGLWGEKEKEEQMIGTLWWSDSDISFLPPVLHARHDTNHSEIVFFFLNANKKVNRFEQKEWRKEKIHLF